jgi:hypothetical protein
MTSRLDAPTGSSIVNASPELPQPKSRGNPTIPVRPEKSDVVRVAPKAATNRQSRRVRRKRPRQVVPKIESISYPWKLIYTPNSIAIIYETTNWMQIFTDGREVSPDANPSWLGYSTGKWEGDTLVVDTRGFNGKIWLDQLDHGEAARNGALPATGLWPLDDRRYD